MAATNQPLCARCHAKLTLGPADDQQWRPADVTDASLEEFLRRAGDRPVLVDCWAAWCGPCRTLAPTIDELARESGGRWLVGKLDVDGNPHTAGQFQIDSIPTLLIFRQGRLVDRLVGLQPKAAIAARLERQPA